MVDSSGNCRLTELENSLLGLPSVYRTYMVQTKKIRSTELQAVYSFGHLLYELAAGCPLGAPFMDAPPPSASVELRMCVCVELRTRARACVCVCVCRMCV